MPVVRGWDLASLREHYEQVEGINWKPAAQTRFAEIDAENSNRTAVAP